MNKDDGAKERRKPRKEIDLIELTRLFPDDETAEKWFEGLRWPDGRYCLHCGSDSYSISATRLPMPYRCRKCRKYFSVKTGSVMQGSNLGYQKWAFGIYLMGTSVKGISSIRVHSQLGITQKTAWHLTQRIREGFLGVVDSDDDGTPKPGTFEVDESYFGGKQANKHYDKKIANAQGGRGKKMVIAVKERESNQISAEVIESRTRESVQGFIRENIDVGNSTIYTDDYKGYNGIPRTAVNHSAGQYVTEQAHVNGVESFWALMKRGVMGTFHHISPKHLQRYVNEFAGRHNIKDKDDIARMTLIALGMVGKRLRWSDLVAGPAAYAFYRQFTRKVDMVNISNLREVAIDEAELSEAVLEG